MRRTAVLKIEDAVSIGLTCLEQGLDDKAVVRENILAAIAENCLPVCEGMELEDYPVKFLNMLHERLGISFEVHDSRITATTI
jgi:hypothetical protein